jgi:pyruvate/2-oxoglutarate dehydrogenase complex dihydrolipoamide acyltransferase (E2) component
MRQFTMPDLGEGLEEAEIVSVPPQTAIVGAGRISQRVVAHRGQPAVRRTLPLSFTFDHRVVKSDLERIS